MTEQEWLTCADPATMLAFLEGTVCDRKLWLFATVCCRRVLHLDPELGGRVVIESTEQWAEGAITRREWEDAIGRINSPLTELRHYSVGRTPECRAAYAIANLFYVGAAPAALGTSYHAWAALQLETYPDTPLRKLNGFMNEVVVSSRPFVAASFGSPSDEDEHDPEPPTECHPERTDQAHLFRCLVGNPFRPVTLNPAWLSSTVVALARGIYEDRAFDRLPILADALMDADCDNEQILAHCRSEGPHCRGCYVVDLVLGKS